MRSFKKIAAMIMAVAMLCSFTALAATVTSVTVEDTTTVDNTATAIVESDAAQNTILAYKGTAPAGANVVYIDQLDGTKVAAEGVSFQLGTKASDEGEYTVLVGGTDVAEAKTATFNHVDATPKYTVTVAECDNGTVSYEGSLVNVNKDTEITFTIIPYLGYELTSLVVNEDECVNDVADGVYTLKVTDNTTIVPVFTAVAEDVAASYTYGKLFDIEESSDPIDDKDSTPKSKLTFGQATEKADATIKSMGMYVQVKNGEAWDDFKTIGGEAYGPEFPASKWTTDYKYGIRFFSFAQGTYKVKSYVKYSDGTVLYGDAIEFTVE